jgi:hypothetical protein
VDAFPSVRASIRARSWLFNINPNDSWDPRTSSPSTFYSPSPLRSLDFRTRRFNYDADLQSFDYHCSSTHRHVNAIHTVQVLLCPADLYSRYKPRANLTNTSYNALFDMLQALRGLKCMLVQYHPFPEIQLPFLRLGLCSDENLSAEFKRNFALCAPGVESEVSMMKE